jgi:hypothetical protein
MVETLEKYIKNTYFLTFMETNERILYLIKEKGPLLPVQASKEINENILMTSARLSELLTAKRIKISNLKVGGSPLYYFPGQETKLQNYTENLNGMEKKAYDLLSQNKILKDSNQEPAIRVALREIKDFATPLQVNYQNKTEIFWKWYLIDNTEAEPMIKKELSEKPIEATQEKLTQKPKEELSKKTLEPKKETTTRKPSIDKELFLKQIQNLFNNNKIEIIEIYNKKSSEIDFLVDIQTSIGNLKYFCKAKNKKKISDADLSSAVIQSQSKNLPLLFLTNGILTKKSQEMLNNEFKNITFKKI